MLVHDYTVLATTCFDLRSCPPDAKGCKTMCHVDGMQLLKHQLSLSGQLVLQQRYIPIVLIARLSVLVELQITAPLCWQRQAARCVVETPRRAAVCKQHLTAVRAAGVSRTTNSATIPTSGPKPVEEKRLNWQEQWYACQHACVCPLDTLDRSIR
jgi:hypothetical protein